MENHLEVHVAPVFLRDFFLEAFFGLFRRFCVAETEAIRDSMYVCVYGECWFVKYLREDYLSGFLSDSRECFQFFLRFGNFAFEFFN